MKGAAGLVMTCFHLKLENSYFVKRETKSVLYVSVGFHQQKSMLIVIYALESLHFSSPVGKKCTVPL